LRKSGQAIPSGFAEPTQGHILVGAELEIGEATHEGVVEAHPAFTQKRGQATTRGMVNGEAGVLESFLCIFV